MTPEQLDLRRARQKRYMASLSPEKWARRVEQVREAVRRHRARQRSQGGLGGTPSQDSADA